MAISSDIAGGVADPHGPLLRGVLARDQSALAKLYDLTVDRVNAVALRVLGSFDGWRDLASLNGLAGSEVAPGTALLVPVGTRKLRTLT